MWQRRKRISCRPFVRMCVHLSLARRIICAAQIGMHGRLCDLKDAHPARTPNLIVAGVGSRGFPQEFKLFLQRLELIPPRPSGNTEAGPIRLFGIKMYAEMPQTRLRIRISKPEGVENWLAAEAKVDFSRIFPLSVANQLMNVMGLGHSLVEACWGRRLCE